MKQILLFGLCLGLGCGCRSNTPTPNSKQNSSSQATTHTSSTPSTFSSSTPSSSPWVPKIQELQNALAHKDLHTLKKFVPSTLVLGTLDHTWFYLLGPQGEGIQDDQSSENNLFESSDLNEYADTLFFRSELSQGILNLQVSDDLLKDGASVQSSKMDPVHLSLEYHMGDSTDPLHARPSLDLTLHSQKGHCPIVTWRFTFQDQDLQWSGLTCSQE